MNRFSLILFLCICLSACNTTEEKKPETKRSIFSFNIPSSLYSLDPAFAKDQATIWATNQLYSTLVQVDNDLNIKPNVAERWEITEDGRVYTFYLRKDVKFHDHADFPNGKGSLVTAEDIAYSMQRLLDDEVASPGRWLFEDRVSGKEAFKAIDQHTFQMILKEPFSPMMGILSMQYCSIVPKLLVEKLGKSFRDNPVGSGPFQLKRWIENEALILERNPDYYEKDNTGQQLPYLDAVRISFDENKRNAYLKFRDGEHQFLSGIDATYVDDLLTEDGKLKAEVKDKVNLDRSAYLNTEYLGFNLEKDHPALSKLKVRQAINYGFDREKMIRYLRNGIGIPAVHGFTPPGLPSFSKQVEGYDYDPDKARKLLAEAGFPNGKGLGKIMLETVASYKDLCTFIQKQLADLGMDVHLTVHPSSFLRELTAKGETSFFRASWIADYPDAESYFAVLYGKHPAPPNYTRFRNEKFDELYLKSINENDEQKKFSMYQDMDRIIIENAPMVPLYYDEVLRFTDKGVSGLGNNAFNLLILKNVKVQ